MPVDPTENVIAQNLVKNGGPVSCVQLYNDASSGQTKAQFFEVSPNGKMDRNVPSADLGPLTAAAKLSEAQLGPGETAIDCVPQQNGSQSSSILTTPQRTQKYNF